MNKIKINEKNNNVLDHLNDVWYIICYNDDSDDNEYKKFIKNHCPCEMGKELSYINIYDHVSYANAMKFSIAFNAQLEINYLAQQYLWFEKDKHKVVCCKVSVNICEEKEDNN